MDFEFWNNCWERPSQPFHVTEPHQLLQRHLKEFMFESPVLVPLSGKSVDLLYLAEEGFSSTAIEFIPSAVEQFFREHKLSPNHHKKANKHLYQLPKIDLWLANFFEITKDDIGLFSQVFDRAALVALPPETRPSYVKHLASLMEKNATLLMVTMDYQPEKMSGPPFHITLKELQTLFPNCHIKELERISFLDNHPRWRELELSYLDEVLYRIELP